MTKLIATSNWSHDKLCKYLSQKMTALTTIGTKIKKLKAAKKK